MDSTEAVLWQELYDTPELINELQIATGSELSIQARLRERYRGDLVRLAIGLNESRGRGQAKFSRADRMWFDRKGLEQSTSEYVARHKAARFDGKVVDLCSGIGGDAIALAERCEVTAVDLNLCCQLWTRWNAEVYEVGHRIETVAEDVLNWRGIATLFSLDPDRRAGLNERARRLEDYQPAVEAWGEIASRFSGGAIKMSPASPFTGRFPDYEIELISYRGECKEAVLWTGSLGQAGRYRATILPASVSIYGEPLSSYAPQCPLGRYIYDPDPAVVRAGMVDQLCVEHGYSRLDSADEYLTSDEPIELPFAQVFEVIGCTNNNDRKIRDAVRSAGFGQVEIKCRHVPVQVDRFRRTLPLDGSEAGVLIFCQIDGVTHAVLCRRL